MKSPKGLVTSPLEEEDISRAAILHEGAPNTARESLSGSKGKERQRDSDPFGDDSYSDDADGGAEQYPPTHDDAEEFRRVEEVRPRSAETLSLIGCRSPRSLLDAHRTYDNGRRQNGRNGGRHGIQHRRRGRRRSSGM